MGWRYFRFRLGYEVRSRLGWLRRKFPVDPPEKQFATLKKWQEDSPAFFFTSRESLSISKIRDQRLKQDYEAYCQGILRYFNALDYQIGTDYDWVTNPSNGYRYDVRKHWTEIPDFSPAAGDIKMVWEKSRFSFLYTIIRYDYHFGKNCADRVFGEIDSWIAANPINRGPNWRCSQEISLRVLNWTFALYYYRNDPELTEIRFNRIIHLIYWQLKHVAANINFSRIAVRNNHALTETLMLYLGGLLFPFFPEAKGWKKRGKAWFETEIAYQIYEDGTFLQFSHNYHRVAIQLLTWALYLAELHRERWVDVVYARAARSLEYLCACTRSENGHLPNYGGNDGALFFPLSSAGYRDYRPQLNAIYYYFNREMLYRTTEASEEAGWYIQNLSATDRSPQSVTCLQGSMLWFPQGGCYLISEPETFSFIKCGSYRDRPAHADNLHLDIWFRGQNVLRDAGSYHYNTDEKWIRYFNGTRSHNTVTLGNHDQMLKGPRFIWFNWSEALSAELEETETAYAFKGRIRAFGELGTDIIHARLVEKEKGQPYWKIKDQVQHQTGLPIRQYWNIAPEFLDRLEITAQDEEGNPLIPLQEVGYYSGFYGVKEESPVIVFETTTRTIQTQLILI